MAKSNKSKLTAKQIVLPEEGDQHSPRHLLRFKMNQAKLWIDYQNRGITAGRPEVRAENHDGRGTGRYSAAGKRATGQYSAAGKRAIEPKRKWQ